jgi:PIN domain nuclease of toxin-antitoxin system
MRLLLDTHVLLWWWTNDHRLSRAARAAILDEANDILVSAASAWETSTKARLGKLVGIPEVLPRFAELVAADGFQPLPITQAHALKAGSYMVPHRDPFDRMLAAQSELESVVLVTRDAEFRPFPVTTLW